MRCDKCGKRFNNTWVVNEFWPKYLITERTGILGEDNSVFLCDVCSRKFKDWLEEIEGRTEAVEAIDRMIRGTEESDD